MFKSILQALLGSRDAQRRRPKGRFPIYRSPGDIQEALAMILSDGRKARLFELFIREGFGPHCPGSLSRYESSEFLSCLAALKAGKNVTPVELPAVADPVARKRVAAWLTNMTRSDMSIAPRNLAELSRICVIADSRTATTIRRVYHTFVVDLFRMDPAVVEGRFEDSTAFSKESPEKRWGDFLTLAFPSGIVLLTFRALEMEEAIIIPNLICTFGIDDQLGLIVEERGSFALTRARFVPVSLLGRPLTDLARASDIIIIEDAVRAERSEVESFWLP